MFFFQAEDGIRVGHVTGVQTCALPICINRVQLIRISAILMFGLSIPLWGWWGLHYETLLVFSAVFGVLQFTLYPLGAAFANDNVDPERRVGLSAILYMVYGVGACLGPLLVGVVMDAWGSHTYFILDRKSTRLNSSHVAISYAVFCLKKKMEATY